MRALAVIAAIGAAATTIATDGNDTAGKLDLKSVEIVRDEPLVRVTIATWERWPAKLLAGRGPRAGKNRLTVLYDVNADRTADYRGRIVFAGGRLSLWITGRGNAFDAVPVKRLSRSTVAFTHPVDIVLKSGRVLWVAVTSRTCGRGCTDRAPNRKWIPVAVRHPPPPPPPALR